MLVMHLQKVQALLHLIKNKYMRRFITFVLLVDIVFLSGCSTKTSMARSSNTLSEARYNSTYIDGDSKILTYLGTALLFGVVYSVALKKSYEDEQR